MWSLAREQMGSYIAHVLQVMEVRCVMVLGVTDRLDQQDDHGNDEDR